MHAHTHTCSQLASPCSRLLRLSTYTFSNTTTYEHKNTLETFSLLCIQLARLCVHLQFHPKSRMLGLYQDLFKLSRNRDDYFTIIINIYRNWFCCLGHTRFPCRTQMRISRIACHTGCVAKIANGSICRPCNRPNKPQTISNIWIAMAFETAGICEHDLDSSVCLSTMIMCVKFTRPRSAHAQLQCKGKHSWMLSECCLVSSSLVSNQMYGPSNTAAASIGYRGGIAPG